MWISFNITCYFKILKVFIIIKYELKVFCNVVITSIVYTIEHNTGNEIGDMTVFNKGVTSNYKNSTFLSYYM